MAIVRRLVENYNTWQLGHEKGIRFCGQLENIKLKLLDGAGGTGTDESCSVFSDDLSTWHQRLQVVMEVFVDIVKNASESVNQLRALEQLQAAGPLDDKDTRVISRTWSIRQFVAVAEKLLAQYQAELQVKEMVYREICHRTTQTQVTLTSCAWSYPRYVSNETRFIIKCLTVECGLPDVDSPGIKE